MIRTIMISTVLVGIGGLGVWPSMATILPPSETEVSMGSIESGKAALGLELANKPSFESHRFFVQRKSSSPPGESHSGRASSSQAGSVAESGRDSGRALDTSDGLSNSDTGSTSHQKPEESVVPPPKGGDPVEGGRKSQPATKRRGGIVK